MVSLMRISRVSLFQSLRPQSTTPSIAIALVLAASSPAFAQSDPTPGAGAAPREGNIYDHRDHQPTEADVTGTASPSSGAKRQVEDEVKALLQQTDKLDKQSEQQDQDYPSGSSSRPKSGQ
jgi:hypothetical protein